MSRSRLATEALRWTDPPVVASLTSASDGILASPLVRTTEWIPGCACWNDAAIIDGPPISDHEREERDRQVAEAIASGRLEGVEPAPAFVSDAAEYVDGHITADELIARARRRWGLD